MHRIIGAIITLVWLAFMALLVQRDVLPYWIAKDPPAQLVSEGNFQVEITNSAGSHVGTTWVVSRVSEHITTAQSLTLLDIQAVSRLLPFRHQVGIETDLTYDQNAMLDSFTLSIEGAGMPIRVTGERYAGEYAVSAKIGSIQQSMSFDSQASRTLGDSLRPFNFLKGLRVGQSWRVRLLDPFALLKGESLDFEDRLVQVTAREAIQHDGEEVETFRVETQGSTAWVADDGRVLKQQVLLPLLGVWTLTDVRFNKDEYEKARRAVKTFKRSK